MKVVVNPGNTYSTTGEDGKSVFYNEGDRFELPENKAMFLIEKGAVSVVEEKPKPAATAMGIERNGDE